jgi:hypothetical protein
LQRKPSQQSPLVAQGKPEVRHSVEEHALFALQERPKQHAVLSRQPYPASTHMTPVHLPSPSQ